MSWRLGHNVMMDDLQRIVLSLYVNFERVTGYRTQDFAVQRVKPFQRRDVFKRQHPVLQGRQNAGQKGIAPHVAGFDGAEIPEIPEFPVQECREMTIQRMR